MLPVCAPHWRRMGCTSTRSRWRERSGTTGFDRRCASTGFVVAAVAFGRAGCWPGLLLISSCALTATYDCRRQHVVGLWRGGTPIGICVEEFFRVQGHRHTSAPFTILRFYRHVFISTGSSTPNAVHGDISLAGQPILQSRRSRIAASDSIPRTSRLPSLG